jgi:hypothetical protein
MIFEWTYVMAYLTVHCLEGAVEGYAPRDVGGRSGESGGGTGAGAGRIFHCGLWLTSAGPGLGRPLFRAFGFVLRDTEGEAGLGFEGVDVLGVDAEELTGVVEGAEEAVERRRVGGLG